MCWGYLAQEHCCWVYFFSETVLMAANTGLARLLGLRCEAPLSPKGLKQMMNRWVYPLQDHGVTFRDNRSNGQRFVEVTYTPTVTEGTQVTQTLGA